MLGKGLESLIPPNQGKGQQGQNQGQNQNQPNQRPVDPPKILEPDRELPAAPEPAAPLPAIPDPVPPPKIISPEPERRPEPPSQPRPQLQSQPQPQLTQSSAVFQIEIEKIKPNPDQPRRQFNEEALNDLAGSIREFGILQPLVVSKVERETQDGVAVEYEIIAGERRYLAARKLGLRSVPAIVRNVSLEREKLELAVIENIQRENLNPIETARAFQRLQEEFRMTQREIAAKLGKSREVVANTMRLLDLPEYIREKVERGELSESHARLLLAIEDPGAQKRLLEDILQQKLTTRDVKERVMHFGKRRGRPPLEEANVPPELRVMQDELSSSLGAPVQIMKGQNTGRITITFYSEEELENILRRLGERG